MTHDPGRAQGTSKLATAFTSQAGVCLGESRGPTSLKDGLSLWTQPWSLFVSEQGGLDLPTAVTL